MSGKRDLGAIFDSMPHLERLNQLCNHAPEDGEITPLKILLKGGGFCVGHPYGMQLDKNLLVLSDPNLTIRAAVCLTEIAGWVYIPKDDIPCAA